jgi:diguanylate cyclase (GGDEF)-like protein
MNTPSSNDGAAAKAARELAQLREQADQARATLARLQLDVDEAESRLGSSQAAQLLEANEHLVIGMLRAQRDAETAAATLSEVSRSAELDTLTELPNRVLLLDRFARAIASARRRRARLALMFLDLDNFKQINDTLGHAAGDEVLKLAAQRLSASVREADTVSRHGGDEFVILLTDVSQASDATLIADKVVAALGAPARVGDHALRLTASIGISIYPDDGEDAGTLIDRADAAMYRAKRQGFGYVVHGEQPSSEQRTEPPQHAALNRPVTLHELSLAEQARRQAQLREANEQLVLVALGAQELQAAAEHEQRRQTELLAVVAHELRGPLSPIRTAAALLGRVHAQEMPRVQAIIERQVEYMSRLVGDLLDVARVYTGRLRLEHQVVDIGGLVDEAVDACRAAIGTRRQRFSIRVPSRALEVHGDPVRLVQILRNLLDNASKYTPDGGEIELSVVVVDDAVVMTVSDSGIGISAETLPRVFDPFVQDTHAIGFNGMGLGIGLTVVRELVEAHGGRIVASSPGKGLGSRFVVTLPLTSAPGI